MPTDMVGSMVAIAGMAMVAMLDTTDTDSTENPLPVSILLTNPSPVLLEERGVMLRLRLTPRLSIMVIMAIILMPMVATMAAMAILMLMVDTTDTDSTENPLLVSIILTKPSPVLNKRGSAQIKANNVLRIPFFL